MFSIIMCTTYMTINYGVLSFFMSIGEFHRSFHAHFHKLVSGINVKSRDIKTKFRDSIKFDNLSKRFVKCRFASSRTLNIYIFFSLFDDTANIYGSIVLGQVIGGTVYISTTLFQLDVVWIFFY